MRTTGVFTIYDYEVAEQKFGNTFYLIPFGDIHRSSPHCAVDRWLDFCNWAKSKKNAYFLGMGDYLDLASTSERPLLTHSALHESSRRTLDDMAMEYVRLIVKEMSFMKGRLIGLVEGNHYYDFIDGTTSTQRMCAMLDCKYLGVSSFVRLRVPESGNRSNTVDIWAHHGLGASRLVGGSLNRVQQMAEAAEADIYLMGHDHKKSVGFVNRLRLCRAGGKLALNHRKVLMARTGSFLKGYVPEEASYIADAGLSPTDMGVVKIELTPIRKQGLGTENIYIDIHASV